MKKTLPMLPLRGKYIFPNTVIHFDVSRSRSVKAIEEAMEHDQMIFLNNQIDPTAEDPGIEDLYRVGTLARIKQVVKLPKNILRVFAEGLFRAELSETVEYEPFYKVEVLYDHVEQQSFEEFEREAFLRMIKEAFEGYAKAWPHLDQNMVNYILLLTDVEILVDELATHIPFSYPEKQKLLEEMDLKERCELMLVMLQEELDVLKLKQKIQQKVKVNIDKNQKEYVLREQIKVIREELGETNVEDEADEFMDYLRAMEDFGKMQNVDIWIVADESSKHKLSDAYTNVQMDGLDIPKETENIIKTAFRGKKKSYSDYDEVYQTVMLHVAVPVRDKSGDVSGAAVVSGPMEMQENTVIQYEKYMLICVMVGAFLALLLSFFFSRQLVRPIIRIKEAALVLAAGNYAHKTGIRRKDELGALAESMDTLSDKLVEAEEFREDLEQSRRDFFSNVSHELRTPIAVMKGYADTLVAGYVTDETKQKEYLQRIQSECNGMEHLVSDLLILSRMQNPD